MTLGLALAGGGDATTTAQEIHQTTVREEEEQVGPKKPAPTSIACLRWQRALKAILELSPASPPLPAC